jgi:branched-subunit amino acid aminotransferase/4-amino-4-deoxychorismate lyase
VQREGSDDALLIGDDGLISETTMANVGFFEEGGVIWPDAPMLQGITKQLLEGALPQVGVPSRRMPVYLRDIASFEGAFLSNARGVAAVGRVDDVLLPTPAKQMATLAAAYASVPWESI